MEQPLLTIGAFARAVGLAPSALRYYDECGLLRPAEVDDTTGYRYYTPDLARRAQAVAQMRDAGLSVEVMRTVLDGADADRRRVLHDVLAEQEALATRRTAVLQDLLGERSAERVTHAVTVDGPALAAAIRQVRAAADADPASPLSGVLLDVAAGAVDVVATNRYWMAVRTLPTSPSDEGRVVVSLPDATRLCDRLDRHDRVELVLGERHVGVGDQIFPARDVAYPAHRMVIAGVPPATERLVLPRAELLAAIDAVGQAELDVEVTAEGVVIGGRRVHGAVDTGTGSVRLTAALTRRALECALGAEVVLHLASDARPVRIVAPYQPGFLALLMPVARVPSER